MGDHFHASLQELRQQLDLMNSRTASILNKSRQHNNMSTHDSGTVGQSSSDTTDNMQQIKHIGATVGTLAKQQEDRFQKLEHQLDLLADQLDDLAPANPQFTPPESPGLSDSASCHSDTSSISSHHSDMPRVLYSEMPPATIADVGGYFYPHFDQHSNSDQKYISNVYTFVGRVNRALRTKSINNIEVFLRGAALRWFHVGLRTNGSHIFDDKNGILNIARFCDSLIILFDIPKSLTTVARVESLHLMTSCMRSTVVEDYVFSALENVRPQEASNIGDASMSIALRKAVAHYNQGSRDCKIHPDTLNDGDLLDILGRLRCSEFEQRFKKALSQDRQSFGNVASSEENKGFGSFVKVQQEPVSAPLSGANCEISTSASAGPQFKHLNDLDTTRPEGRPVPSTSKMPVHVESEFARSVASATKPYPPAPSAESCPTTLIASCQPSSRDVNQVSQITNVCDGTRVLVATQPGVVDPSILISPEMAKKFGFQAGCQPTQKQVTTMLQQIYMQQMAQLQRDTILDGVSLVQAPDPPSDDAGDNGKWYNRPKDDELAPETGSLDIPEDADNCLAGLTFVITGQLKHISEAEGQDLIRRYGGKCMTAPSKNTSFVILGTEPGPKKLATIKQFNLKVIDERGLFALISELPAYVRPVTEQKKDADGLKKVTEDVPTTTTSLNQEQDRNPTAPISSQPPPQLVQQSQQQQQDITQPPGLIVLDLQARAFLDGFKVFPAIDVNPTSAAYVRYRNSIMSTLTSLVAMQASAISRFGQIQGRISQLESAGQTVHPDLESARIAARADLQAAKTKIDAILKENEKNRAAWFSKPFTPQTRRECDDLVAAQRNTPISSKRVENRDMTSCESDDPGRPKRLHWDI